MKINEAGLNLIKEFEGLELTAYLCPALKLTVGYGHLVHPKDNIALGEKIPLELAELFLKEDIVFAEAAVNSLVKVPLSENQFSALVSFVYNLGRTAFANSTLLKLLNLENYDLASDQFLRWVIANGKVLDGLKRRRAAERKLYLTT